MPNQVGFSRHLSLSVRGRKDGTNDSLMTARNLQRRKFLRAGKWIFDTSDGTRAFSDCRFPIILFAFHIGRRRRRKIAEPKPEWQRERMARSCLEHIKYFISLAEPVNECLFPEKKVPVMKSRKRNNVFSFIIHSKPSDKSFLSSSSSFTFGYFLEGRWRNFKKLLPAAYESFHEKYIFVGITSEVLSWNNFLRFSNFLV